jgi:hypothetical protein
MIVGAEKAGTSSLTSYVAQHPNIVTHISKALEFPLFLSESCEWKTYKREYKRRFERLPRSNELVLAKNVDVMFVPQAPKWLKAHNAECKVIAVLRNPADRAYSSYWYQIYRGAETLPTFEEAIEAEEKHEHDGNWSRHRSYIAKGRYCEQLLKLEQVFGNNTPYVLLLEDLNASPYATVQGIFQFLGLEPYDVDTGITKNRAKAVRWPQLARLFYKQSVGKTLIKRLIPFNMRWMIRRSIQSVNSVGQAPPEMKSATRSRLIDYYRPHNERLAELLGRDLSHWNR